MFTRNAQKAALLASVCLVPLSAAMAGDFDDAAPAAAAAGTPVYNNEVEIGLRVQSAGSAVFGRYNGSPYAGVSVLGGWSARNRDDVFYYQTYGRDLDFGRAIAPNSTVGLKVGEQGSWGLSASYDAISYTQSLDYQSLFNSNGTFANGGPGTTYASAAAAYRTLAPGILSAVQKFEVGTRRDTGEVAGDLRFNDWLISTSFSHEHKSGTVGQSIDISTNMAFLAPVDYDTDRYRATLAYNGEKLQGKLTYSLSSFRDNLTSIRLDSPVQTAGVANAANVVLPPSNIAHNLNGQMAYNLTDKTRLNLNMDYGVQIQNAVIQPEDWSQQTQRFYSGDPQTLNGVVQTIFTNASIVTQPMKDVNLRTSYTLDMREGNRAHYHIRQGEMGTSAGWIRDALTQSYIKNTALIEAGYRILPSTKLTLGYVVTDMQRTNAQVGETLENRATAKVRTTAIPGVTTSLGYEHAVRTVSDVDESRPWKGLNNSGDCQTASATQNGTYCLGIASYQAARTQDVVPLRLSTSLGDDATLGLNSKFTANNYPGQTFGVRREYMVSSGPDVSYRVTEGLDAHTFYTFQRSYRSMAMSKGSEVANPQTTIGLNWSEATTIDTSTFGLGATWKPSNEWKFGFDYLFNFGNEGVFVSLPGKGFSGEEWRVDTMNNSVKVFGEYEFVPGASLNLAYNYDRLVTDDPFAWGSPFYGTAGTSGALLTGQGNAAYNVHTVMSRVSYKW